MNTKHVDAILARWEGLGFVSYLPWSGDYEFTGRGRAILLVEDTLATPFPTPRALAEYAWVLGSTDAEDEDGC